MKATHHYRAETTKPSLRNELLHGRENIRTAVARAKDATLKEFSEQAGENLRLLQLALNEAEGLAWQTEYPHLVFPSLAAEKARYTIRWHQRQHAVRGATQFSFVE
jgi:hypothetical protein